MCIWQGRQVGWRGTCPCWGTGRRIQRQRALKTLASWVQIWFWYIVRLIKLNGLVSMRWWWDLRSECEASKVSFVFLFWFKSCSKPESGTKWNTNLRLADADSADRIELSFVWWCSVFLRPSYFSRFRSNDATFVEARENENMVLVLHSTGSCKRNAVHTARGQFHFKRIWKWSNNRTQWTWKWGNNRTQKT